VVILLGLVAATLAGLSGSFLLASLSGKGRAAMLVTALSAVTGYADSRGFVHAAHVWSQGQVVWREVALSGLGFLVGVVDRAKILGPQRVREGDALLGIPSTGLHTNGYSLAREICARRAMHERSASLLDVLLAPREELEGATLGTALLAVHRPYLAEFRALREVAEIHSIAHLTGGGWEGNLPRALPDGTAAWIDRESWEVPAIFTLLARLGDLEEIEQFDTWNMGIGLIVAIASDALDAALAAVPGAVALGRVVPHSAGRRVVFG